MPEKKYKKHISCRKTKRNNSEAEQEYNILELTDTQNMEGKMFNEV